MPSTPLRFFAALCAGGLLTACSGEPASAPPPPVVLVDTVGSAAAARIALTGEIRARHEFDLAFRVGGRLLKRHVDTGATVRPGQVLAELDPQDLQLAEQAASAQLAAARSELYTARAEHARQADLLARKFISQAAFDAKENALKTAQARFEQAGAQAAISGNQADYGRLSSTAPAVVLATLAEAGQVVAAGQPVLRLARPEAREVAIAIPEQSIEAARQAQSWQVHLPALPDLKLRAELRELAPAADPQTRTYAARLRLLDAPASVQLGMSARAEAATEAAPALKVPLTALVDTGHGAQVWVIADNKAQARPVEVERYTEDGAILRAGLKAGEQVVVAGASRLSADQPVRTETRRPPNEQR